MRDISKNIRQARMKKGLSQDALAELLHVTRQTVSNYETGRSRPDVDMLVSIGECLGLTVNELIYGPPVSEDTRRSRKKLLILSGVCLVLLAVLLFLSPIADELQRMRYEIWLKLLLRFLLAPGLYMLLGYTLMEAAGLFLKARPLRHPAARWVRWAVLGFLLFYLLLFLPTVLHAIVAQLHPGAAEALLSLINATPLGHLPMQLYLPFLKIGFGFLLPGALLWALPRRKKT